MDVVVVGTGTALLVVGVAFLMLYLFAEKGSLLDPVAVSWTGFIVYVAIAMILVGRWYPDRDSAIVRTWSCAIAIAGIVAYAAGLYLGNGRLVARSLPTPAPTLSGQQLWLIWLITGGLTGFGFLVGPKLGPALARMLGGVTAGCMGAAALTGIFGFFVFRKSLLTRLVMLASYVGIVILTLNTAFSRRPVIGLAIVAVAFVYRYRLARKSRAAKLLGVAALGVVTLIVGAYLSATRAHRFYGAAAGRQHAVFSLETFATFLGGVEVNYRMWEFSVQQFPQNHEFLHGRGLVTVVAFFIPRAAWPGKPVATANLVSRLWYNTDDLSNNLGLPPPAEAYVNFGFIGVPICLFILGKATRVLNTYMRGHSQNIVLWLAWFTIIPDFAAEWRGDFTSMTIQAFLRVAVFLGITWLAGRLFRRPGRAIGELNAEALMASPGGAPPSVGGRVLERLQRRQ